MTSYAEMARQRKRARPLYLELRALGLGLHLKEEAADPTGYELVMTGAGSLSQVRTDQLRRDRDALLDSLVEIGAEALDALSPDERNQLYRILQLKVVLNKDAMPELSGVFGQGLNVCTLESQP